MAIIRKEAYFNSSTGKNKIRAMIWQDEKVSPVGVLQIAHGVSEHIERYDDFARVLAENGFVVCGNDHLGHGKSVNALGDLGYLAEKNGHFRMVDDMHILYKIMHKRFPDLPYFLFGHSMGSFCARVYSAVFGHTLAGAIYSGTGQFPVAAAAVKGPLDKLVKKFGADKSAGSFMDVLGRVQSLPFEDGKEDALAWLSRDKENREEYRDDPLCGAPLKLGGIRDLIFIGLEASRPNWASKLPLDLPVLLISGAKDPVGGNGKGVLAVADALEEVGIEPTVILYPNDRHEILQEDDKEKVYADVLKWLKLYV
ncbi:MAG: lysophospholipase [Oscillospiraceae bacterium]|jgi:alpha-beta hydrolase superfamily lysophospholipase|nr:lysophospholipase [Oscillospiraceae bacterium]